MITLKQWQELCKESGKVYYWNNDKVVIHEAKEYHPSYTHGYLSFTVDLAGQIPDRLFINEKDCVLDQIKRIEKDYHSILIGGC